MNILDKLHKIEEEKIIYDIHYCKGGIGFLFWYEEKVIHNWKEGLSVEKYYPTFEEAVEAEFDKLKEE